MLAARLKVTRRQIAYYESGQGRPPGALLGKLADLFEISTDALLGRRRPQAPPLGLAVDARLGRIARMGGGVARRLAAHLDRFIASELDRR